MAIALRHRAAVDALELRGDERVLEIGCGHGVATRLLLGSLPRGHVTAIDRSAKMIAALRRAVGTPNNLDTVSESLELVDWGDERFDALLSINVNLELRLRDRWPEYVLPRVVPDGRIVLAFEAPTGSGNGGGVAFEAAEALLTAGCATECKQIAEGGARVSLVLAKAPR